MAGKPLVLVSSNRKGGCFKSSGTFHLGGAFAARGMRTLLLDADPQGSLSQSFFSSRVVEELAAGESLAALFDDRLGTSPLTLVHATPIENLAIVPASGHLTQFNHADPKAHGWLQDSLRQFIVELGDRFDCVLIDTPPNLQLVTWAAMVASDFVLTPVIPEDYAAQGLVHVKRFIEDVQASRNGALRWMGLLLTMVQNRLGVHVAYERVIRQAYGQLVLDTVIPHAAIFKEAVAAKTPVTLYKPRVAAAKTVTQLAEEIARRAGLELPQPSQTKKRPPRQPRKKEAA